MNKIFFGLFFSLTSITAHSESIATVLDDNALGCRPEPSESIISIYGKVTNGTFTVKKIGNDTITIGNKKISGVRSFVINDKNIFLSLDIKQKKYDAVITKLAFLSSPQGSDDEWGGYYYVVEAKNDVWLKFKNKYQIDDSYIKKTPVGNYRITCVIFG